jgi:hypothetical protein
LKKKLTKIFDQEASGVSLFNQKHKYAKICKISDASITSVKTVKRKKWFILTLRFGGYIPPSSGVVP